MGALAEEQDLIAGEQFFVGAGVHEVGARPLNGDDTGARLGAKGEFADQFALAGRAIDHGDGDVPVGVARLDGNDDGLRVRLRPVVEQ